MTKLKITDHKGNTHEFDQPVSVRVGTHGELLVFEGEKVGSQPVAGFHGDWYFEWGVRHESKGTLKPGNRVTKK